jgi:hypothetical protein
LRNARSGIAAADWIGNQLDVHVINGWVGGIACRK